MENLIEIQANFGEPMKDDPLELAAKQKYFPSIRDIHILDLRCDQAFRAFNIVGTADTPIHGIKLDSVQVVSSQNANIVQRAPDASVKNSTLNKTPLTL